MNDNQEYEEQARKLDQFHDKYHQQKQPNWLNTKAEADVEATAKTGTYDVGRRTIEVDAATIAVLAIVSELLPEQIQEQLRTIVTLHEKTWQIDIPAVEGETPRKPLSEELIETIAREDDSSEV